MLYIANYNHTLQYIDHLVGPLMGRLEGHVYIAC